MTTRKNKNSQTKINNFSKTRSKKQRGGGAVYSRPGRRSPNRNIIEEDDLNTIHEYLELAIDEEMPRQVKEYLAAGANPNITILDEHLHLHEDVRPEPEDIPAILYAARHIKPSTIMEQLVEYGASIEQYPNTGTTPLIEAAEYGNLDAVRYLLSIGADINATTGSGVPAIVYAVMNEDIPMIRLMLNERDGKIDLHYTVFDTDRENVIGDAVKNAADPAVARILKEYANKIKHKNMRDARFVMEKGTYTDGRQLLPHARRDVATMVSKFLGGKTRKSNKKNRKSRSKRTGGSGKGKGKRGTDTSEVKPNKKSKTILDDVCPICLNELTNMDNIPKLPCKHKFHKECLGQLCNTKNNKNVHCPICRRDISFECKSNITRDTPWIYDPYTNPSPYSETEFRDMNDEERRQAHNEENRHHSNWLARRRRMMTRETPEQLAQRTEIEQDYWTRVGEERHRYYHNTPFQERRDITRINSAERRDRLSRGLPLPESPYPQGIPNGHPPIQFVPGSPDYPPPSPQSAPGSPHYSPPPTLIHTRL